MMCQFARKVLVLVTLLLALLISLRHVYRNMINVHCLRDAKLIDASTAPIPSLASSAEWRALASGQDWFGDENTAICLAQRTMLEGHDPFASISTNVEALAVLEDDNNEGILPTVRLSLRALASRELGLTSPLDLFLAIIAEDGRLPVQWLYQPYEESLLAKTGSENDFPSRIRYQNTTLRSMCVTLGQKELEWALPIPVQRLQPADCEDGDAVSNSGTSGPVVYNLLPNGGFEWTVGSGGRIPGFENMVYEEDESGGAIQAIDQSNVLALNNHVGRFRQGLATTKLAVVPGRQYMLGATLYTFGGNPLLGINCWLSSSEVWTWYAIGGLPVESSYPISLFDIGRIPGNAQGCYAIILNSDSPRSVWFDNLFLLPVQPDNDDVG